MRIYTRTGDKGRTSLVYGERVAKNDPRVEAYGTCDEANSMIGFALSMINGEKWAEKASFMKRMHHVQTVLFHVGAELSTPKHKEVVWKLEKSHIDQLENYIDEWDKQLPSLEQFILPYGHQAASVLHIARTIVRRAERNVISIDESNELVLAFLNRLSDLLFVAARYVNFKLGGEEIGLHEE